MSGRGLEPRTSRDGGAGTLVCESGGPTGWACVAFANGDTECLARDDNDMDMDGAEPESWATAHRPHVSLAKRNGGQPQAKLDVRLALSGTRGDLVRLFYERFFFISSKKIGATRAYYVLGSSREACGGRDVLVARPVSHFPLVIFDLVVVD